MALITNKADWRMWVTLVADWVCIFSGEISSVAQLPTASLLQDTGSWQSLDSENGLE